MHTRPLDSLGARVKYARGRRELKQTELAAIAKMGQSDVSKIERGEILQTTAIARLANALCVNPLWLETGDGPEPDWQDVSLNHGVAQNMSLARPTLSQPKVAWEELNMGATPDQPFELDVIDDALAPDIFTGCVAMMDPHREPEPAWPALVRTAEGKVYLRDYEEGPGETWRAVARARGYAAMSSEDGLTIIAVMEGYRRPPRTRPR